MPDPVVVVGGGLSGLASAAELALHGPVVLVERLPAPGGVWEFDHPAVASLVRACKQRGVTFVLGVVGVRWRDKRLLLVGPGHVEWLPAARLVFAGGTRPMTLAELRIAGGRLAGVFPATVAHHLLEAGVSLGRRPLVLGGGEWADLLVPLLTSRGPVTLVGDDPGADSGAMQDSHLHQPSLVRRWPGHRATRVSGTSRVDRVELEGASGHRQVVHCDCVVVAGELRPLRNVDGAVADDAVSVHFVQPTAPRQGADDVIAFGRESILRMMSGDFA